MGLDNRKRDFTNSTIDSFSELFHKAEYEYSVFLDFYKKNVAVFQNDELYQCAKNVDLYMTELQRFAYNDIPNAASAAQRAIEEAVDKFTSDTNIVIGDVGILNNSIRILASIISDKAFPAEINPAFLETLRENNLKFGQKYKNKSKIDKSMESDDCYYTEDGTAVVHKGSIYPIFNPDEQTTQDEPYTTVASKEVSSTEFDWSEFIKGATDVELEDASILGIIAAILGLAAAAGEANDNLSVKLELRNYGGKLRAVFLFSTSDYVSAMNKHPIVRDFQYVHKDGTREYALMQLDPARANDPYFCEFGLDNSGNWVGKPKLYPMDKVVLGKKNIFGFFIPDRPERNITDDVLGRNLAVNPAIVAMANSLISES